MVPTTDKPWKALMALVITLVGGIAVGYADDSLTKGEFWSALAAALVSGGGVYGVSNKPRNEQGGADLATILIACAVAIVVVALAFVLFDGKR